MGNSCCSGPPDVGAEERVSAEPGSAEHEVEPLLAVEVPEEHAIEAEVRPEGGNGEADWISKEAGKQERLSDGIDLFTYKDDSRFTFLYEVTNNKLSILEFTVDATGSKNMIWQSAPTESKVTVEIPPMSTEEVGLLKMQDKKQAASLSIHFKWVSKKADKTAVKEARKEQEAARRALGDQMRAKDISGTKLGGWHAIKEACQKNGLTEFIDIDFFPDDHALFDNPEEHPAIIWKRAGEIFETNGSGPVRLFNDDDGLVRPDHVRQGALGDCWFLGSLAALAEFPKLVKKLFKNKHPSHIGCYEVECYKNGVRTSVVIDDYLPCDPGTGKPCYSKCADGTLWVSLLEKAWAKLHGGYEHIEAGVPYQALMDLTGAPGRSISVSQKEIAENNLFETLENWDKQNYVMVAGTPGRDTMTKSGQSRPTGGIVPGHAYTLRTVKSALGEKLLELRNPWGSFEWKGDWSDNCAKWTEEMKDAFKPSFGDDGIFWMSEADFAQEFNTVNVVHFRGRQELPWADARVQLTTTASTYVDQVMEFEVGAGEKAKGRGWLTLIQKDKRIKGTADYSRMAFALYGPLDASGAPAREILRSPNYSSGKRELVEELGGAEPLAKGKYIVAVFSPAKVKDVTATLVVQLDEGPNHKEVQHRMRQLTPELRAQLALATCMGGKANEKGPFDIVQAWLPDSGSCALSVKSRSHAAMTLSLDFSNAQGWEVVAAKQGKKVDVKCEPNGKLKLATELTEAAGMKAGPLRYGMGWKG